LSYLFTGDSDDRGGILFFFGVPLTDITFDFLVVDRWRELGFDLDFRSEDFAKSLRLV